MDMKERIQNLCKKNCISVNKLEKILGFGNGYICKLGQSTPNASKLTLIADYFNVSVAYIMTGEERNIPTFSPDHIELISAYDKLSNADKLAIMQIIKSLSDK